MELEILKQSWERLDKKIQHAAILNQTFVERIISSRVITTVDKIKILYNGFYVVLSVETIALLGVLAGNPFDFRYTLQYLPYLLLLIGVVIAFFNLLHISRSIARLSAKSAIDQYVREIVAIYDRNKRFEKWFGLSFLAVGFLVPFSFIPNKIARVGVVGALIDTAIMILITWIMLFAAFKFGFFKNRHKERLEKDLEEWKELKALANEMAEP
jgi:xanthosine utilization system XapX-like protein